MWHLFIFLNIAFGAIVSKGEVAPICDSEKCIELLPHFPVEDAENLFPDEARLEIQCPHMIRFVECIFEDFITCLGQTSQELVSSENKTVADTVTVFLGVASIMEDICDPSSQLHKDYVENVVCSRKVFYDRVLMTACRDEARSLFESLKGAEEEVGESIADEYKECLISAYEYGCESEKLLEFCGKDAQTTFLTIVKRSKIMKYGACSAEDLPELRKKFIAHLKEEDQRNAFEQLFEFRRK